MIARDAPLRKAFDEFTLDLESTVTTVGFIEWLRVNKPELLEGLDEDAIAMLADTMIGMTRYQHQAG